MPQVQFSAAAIFNKVKNAGIQPLNRVINYSIWSKSIRFWSAEAPAFPDRKYHSFVLFEKTITLKLIRSFAKVLRDYQIPSGFDISQAAFYEKVYIVGAVEESDATLISSASVETKRLTGTGKEMSSQLKEDVENRLQKLNP